MCVNLNVGVCADRVLEAKQHQLDLVDGGGVKVEVQLKLGDGSRHDAPLRRMNEVPKDADYLLNMFNRQLELFTALLYKQKCIKMTYLLSSNCKYHYPSVKSLINSVA